MDKVSAVIYCDGGFLLDKKLGGVGVHGYLYIEETPKRGTGNSKATPTPLGYAIDPSDKKEQVTVINYIDIIKGVSNVNSSTEVEAHALLESLTWLDNYEGQLEQVTIYNDNRNVTSSVNGWIEKWIKANWVNSAGAAVKYRSLWENVWSVLNRVKEKTSVKIEWIKGHDGYIGNETADKLASRGNTLALNADPNPMVTISDPAGYWADGKVEVPRLLEAPRLYLATYDEALEPDGSTYYYMGSHGGKEREHGLEGKVYACNFLTINKVYDPDPIITQVKEMIHELELKRGGPLGTIVTVNTQNVLSKRIYNEISSTGMKFMVTTLNPITISTFDGLILAEEVVPVGRAFRLLEMCAILRKRLESIVSGDTSFILKDLKPTLISETETKKGIKYKIKDTIKQTTRTIKVPGLFSTSKEDVTQDTFTHNVQLVMGMDIPGRNQLSALMNDIVSLDLVTWRDSSSSCRYGTLIKLENNNVALWSRYDANLIIAPSKKK